MRFQLRKPSSTKAIMEDENSNSTNLRQLLLFISGIGILALATYFLIFGQTIFGLQDPDSAAVNIQITPVDPDDINRGNFFDESDLAGAVQVGQAAPNFTLIDLDGNTHTLESVQGRPVIVNFWATWCAPCRVEMPEFEEAFADYAEDDLVILAVNREESAETVEAFFVQEMDLSFTPLLDSNADVAERYGVFNMPTTYFVDQDGIVSDVHRGPVARVQLDEYLSKIINQ